MPNFLANISDYFKILLNFIKILYQILRISYKVIDIFVSANNIIFHPWSFTLFPSNWFNNVFNKIIPMI